MTAETDTASSRLVDAVLNELAQRSANDANATSRLKASRKAVAEIFRGAQDSLSSLEVTWKLHTLISSSTGPFTLSQHVSCLLAMEHLALSSSASNGDTLSNVILPIAFRDALFVARRAVQSSHPVEYECLMNILERMLPRVLDTEDGADIERMLRESQDLVGQKLSSAATAYDSNRFVYPVLWASNDHERRTISELSQGRSVVNTELPTALCRSIRAPFPRPLPPPLLPIYDYSDDDDGSGDIDENDSNDRSDNDEVTIYMHSELLWLTPTNLGLLLLSDEDDDDDDDDDDNTNEDFHYALSLLQTKAFQTPFTPQEQRKVLDIMGNAVNEQNDHQFIEQSGLTPQNLPKLVEHNPLIANECLCRILLWGKQYESLQNEYLSALVGMDMTLHVMEVVNRLATYPQPILHPEYINLFITSCIASCENTTTQSQQNRLVRLVCVFIQSLLRNKIVHVNDIHYEVQSFCIEFSRIREAAALFKLLKSM